MLSLLVLSVSLAAPAHQNPHLVAAIEQLAALDDRGALVTLERAAAWPENDAAELSWVHVYFGLAWAGLNEKKKALESFKTALTLAPERRLPPSTSPTVQQWWKEAGGASNEKPKSGGFLAESLAPPPPKSVTPRWVALGLFGGGALAAGVGGGLGAFSQELARSAHDPMSSPRIGDALSLQGQAERSALAANVLFAAAGVLALAALVSLLFGV